MEKANDARSALLTLPPAYQLTFEGIPTIIHSKVFIFFLTHLPSYQKYSIFLILTTMSDLFGLDCHERIGHS
jgi:hypothetical protein